MSMQAHILLQESGFVRWHHHSDALKEEKGVNGWHKTFYRNHYYVGRNSVLVLVKQ